MKEFTFRINEIPPSVNRLYRPAYSGKRGLHIRKNEVALDFETSAWAEIDYYDDPFDVPVVLDVLFEIKDTKKFNKSDIDNMMKILLDSLQKVGVIKNDNLVYKIIMEKRIGDQDSTNGTISLYKK